MKCVATLDLFFLLGDAEDMALFSWVESSVSWMRVQVTPTDLLESVRATSAVKSSMSFIFGMSALAQT